jgi:hypothetical protein
MEFIQTTKEEVTPKYEKTSLSLSKIRLDATTLLDGLYGRPGQNILSPANIAQEMHPARTDRGRSSVGRTGFATCCRIDYARSAD